MQIPLPSTITLQCVIKQTCPYNQASESPCYWRLERADRKYARWMNNQYPCNVLTGVIFPKYKITWLWLCDYFLIYSIYYCGVVHISFFMIRYNYVLESIMLWVVLYLFCHFLYTFYSIWGDWICGINLIFYDSLHLICYVFSFSIFSFSLVFTMNVCGSWTVAVEVM